MKRFSLPFAVLAVLVAVSACLSPICAKPSAFPSFRTASCLGPDGQSRCGPTPRWNKTHANAGGLLGSASGGDRAATTPPAQTVPAWFTDTLNTAGCASDNNTCTQATCGAVGSFQGPCLSVGEIYDRWGTIQPTLAQDTSLTVLSPLALGDLVYLDPRDTVYGNVLSVACTLGADPPVQYQHTPGCHDLGDEPCGTGGCCYGWQDWHCEPIAQRCEYHHDTVGSARDSGSDVK